MISTMIIMIIMMMITIAITKNDGIDHHSIEYITSDYLMIMQMMMMMIRMITAIRSQ